MRNFKHRPTPGQLAAFCSTLVFATALPAFADDTAAPVVARKKLAPGETRALNPQPIPPGKSATATKEANNGAAQSIIFVGGKKAKTDKTAANAAAPTTTKVKAGALHRDAHKRRQGEKK